MGFQQANIRSVSREQIGVAIALVPAPIVTIAPVFRGYQAVQLGSPILIVEPRTQRIHYIMDV
jgi:hypothetical protein